MTFASIQNSIYYPRVFLILFIFLVGLLFVAYSIKKLKYGWKEIWRSVWISGVIALVISLIWFFVLASSTHILCSSAKMCVEGAECNCPTGYDIYLPVLPFAFLVIFFFTWIVYYVVQWIRKKGG